MAITLQIRDSDLKIYHPQLQNDIWPENLILTEGNNGECPETNVLSFNLNDIISTVSDWDGYLKLLPGKYVNIIGHRYNYQIIEAAFDDTDPDVVLLKLEYSPDPSLLFLNLGDSGIKFQIGGYQMQIAEAFRQLLNDLIDRGIDVNSISATDTFREAQLYKAFTIIFRDFKMADNDRWDMLLKDYANLYSKELTNTKIEGTDSENILRSTRIQL